MADIIKQVATQVTEKDLFKVLTSQSEAEKKSKKLLIYKFFFFNYLLSVTMNDVLKVSSRHSLRATDESLKDTPYKIHSALEYMLELLKDKHINAKLDELIGGNRRGMSSLEDEKRDDMIELDDSQSTTLSIKRMIVFNMQSLIKATMQIIDEEKKATKKQQVNFPDYLLLSEYFSHSMSNSFNRSTFDILMNIL